MRRNQPAIFFTAIVTAVFALSACASDDESGGDDFFTFSSVSNAYEYAKSRGYDDSAVLLEDGVITADEYREAESSYQSCLEGQGYVFSDLVVDPIGGLQLLFTNEYTGPPDEADTDAINTCQDAYDPVEQSFTQTQEQRMDPQLLAAVKLCLDNVGFEYPAAANNLKSLSGDTGGIPGPVQDCVTTEVRKLFPDLPVLAIGY